ncbi:MAG: LysE family transporter [Nitrospirae bacterium]|nr:LysE family transporter [Nitrospirota bacterium]
MNIMLIAVSSFMIALSGALVPGPLFTVTVSESARRGFVAGPLIILGHGILELSLVLLIVSGINQLAITDGIKAMISITGGIILIVMGGMMLKDVRKARLEFGPGDALTPGLHPVLTGVLGSISNPYWIIWWLTIGLGYLLSAVKFGPLGVVAFFAGHISADLAWYSLIALAVSRGRKLLGDAGYRNMLYACGIFLILFGGWFIRGA